MFTLSVSVSSNLDDVTACRKQNLCGRDIICDLMYVEVSTFEVIALSTEGVMLCHAVTQHEQQFKKM